MRTVLHLHPALAPFKVRRACPCRRTSWATRRAELYAKLTQALLRAITTRPAPSASAIAVRTKSARPTASAVDFDTEATGKVTVRDRDTMQQEVVAVDDLVGWINEKIDF